MNKIDKNILKYTKYLNQIHKNDIFALKTIFHISEKRRNKYEKDVETDGNGFDWNWYGFVSECVWGKGKYYIQ